MPVDSKLLAQLGHEDWQVRQRAIERLGELGLEAVDALPALRDKLLNDVDEDVRAAAIAAAAAVTDDQAALLPDFTRCLSDGNPKVRAAAVTMLGRLGASAEPAFDSLLDRALDDDSSVRAAAIEAIQKIQPDAGILLDRANSMVLQGDRHAPGILILLSRLSLDDPLRDRALTFLWEVVCTAEIWLAGNAFESFALMFGDSPAILQKVLNEPRLAADMKGSLLLLTDQLNAVDSAEAVEPVLDVVTACLTSAFPFARSAAQDWLLLRVAYLTDAGAAAVVASALRGVLEFGEGFRLLRRLLGDDEAVNALRGQDAVAPGVVPRVLLRDGSDLLDGMDAATFLEDALSALEDDDWVIRQAAADWLGKAVGGIDRRRLDDVRASLQKASGDYDPDVRRSVELALIAIDQRLRTAQSAALFDALETGDEEAKTEVLHKILELRDRDTARRLVRLWTRWIGLREQPALVEIVGESLRAQPETVRPLVDQFDQDPELDNAILEQICDRAGIPRSVAHPILAEKVAASERSLLGDWLTAAARYYPDVTAAVEDTARQEGWSARKHAAVSLERVLAVSRDDIRARISERIAQQLALMADRRYFAENDVDFDRMKSELNLHALPMLSRALIAEEVDKDNVVIREAAARALGNLGGREAVESLTRAVIGEERTRQRRQQLLADYYLEPSKNRSEEAATILRGAVKSAERTLRILQILNILLFGMGLAALGIGIGVGIFADDGVTRVAGALAGLGGLGGIAIELLRNPLAQIQTAMTRLVQVETAFTSFIWELNLHGTFIQSQYVARGVLADDEIARTGARIEAAMSLAMESVASYTRDKTTTERPQLFGASPVAGEAGTQLRLIGDALRGVRDRQGKALGLVAVDHTPVHLDISSWTDTEVRFALPTLPNGRGSTQQVWLSLVVDGRETNAVPFTVLRRVSGNGEVAAGGDSGSPQTPAGDVLDEHSADG